MTDRELLALAAKVAGIDDATWDEEHQCMETATLPGFCCRWNPLTDDGDAFRLAVNLGIATTPYPVYAFPKHSVIAKQNRMDGDFPDTHPQEAMELYGDDPYAATRRAIVRAAAEIGRNKQEELLDAYLMQKHGEIDAEKKALLLPGWLARPELAKRDRKDVERYRYLRDAGMIECPNCISQWKCNGPHITEMSSSEIDEAIDNAMKGEVL